MQNKEIPLTINHVPVIHVSYSDKDYLALVDTGSELTIFDSGIAHKENMITEDKGSWGLTLVTPGGNSDKLTGHVSAELSMTCTDGSPYNVKFEGVTSDLSMITNYFNDGKKTDEEFLMILGNDTLHAMDAVIDYNKEVIRFNNDLSCK